MNEEQQAGLGRRKFLRNSIAAGAGLLASRPLSARADDGEDLRFGIIGCGAQAEALRSSSTVVQGIRFAAVADISRDNLRRMAARIRASKLGVGEDRKECTYYERAEKMIEKEKLDAVIVATPCFLHHRYTNLALDAGLHVYCEKMMSNSIENARSMVKAQRKSGKLLQIGHQRRSNPFYIHARNLIVLGDTHLLGHISKLEAEWNRTIWSAQARPIPKKKRRFLDDDLLKEFGYGTGLAGMWNWLNWRMVKGLGSGILGDLGTHQIDVMNWFMQTTPTSVSGTGSIDYFTPERLKKQLLAWIEEKEESIDPEVRNEALKLNPTFDFPDEAVAKLEYRTPAKQWDPKAAEEKELRKSWATYKVSSNAAKGGFYEQFVGEKGSMKISENTQVNELIAGQNHAAEWVAAAAGEKPRIIRKPLRDGIQPLSRWEIPVQVNEPAHAAHLRNFVETIRNGGAEKDLNCPGEEGFRTTVTVLKSMEAIAAKKTIELKPADFEA